MKKIMLFMIFVVLAGGIGAVLWILQGDGSDTITSESFLVQAEDGCGSVLDFEALKQINPDIYAWIQIPGTNIDSPVVQNADDNSYYLTHGANGEESSFGAIFTENHNDKLFQDYITGMYANNEKDGNGFYELYRYTDKKFMDENPIIMIYLPDCTLQYRIFAAYVGDDSHVVLNYEKGKEKVYREVYLDSIFEQRTMDAIIDRNTSVDYNSKVLTLSTNHKSGNNFRFLVQAYLEQIKK